MSLQNFAVARLGGFAVDRSAVVNGQGGFVQIALELKAGLANEVFVLRIAVFDGMLAQVGEQANGLEVDVEDGVGIRQQADGVGGGALSQQNGGDDATGDDQDNR